MQTIDCDQQLILNDDRPYSEGDDITFSQDSFRGPQLAMFHTRHRGVDLHKTFSVGGWEAGNSHRKVCHGPKVEGPHAWMNENGIALTAHRQEKRPEIMVDPGDRLIIRGTTYEIAKGRHGEIELFPVSS